MLRRTLMGIALVALLAPMAGAQTVDEIVAKNIQAKGGMEKIKAVKSIRFTGKMMMGSGLEAPFTMEQKRPKMTRMEFTFQGMTGMQAYDGKNAWQVMPFMGKKDPEALPAEQVEIMEEQADMDGPLVEYKEKGNTVELLGKEQVEGADTYKLKLTLKNGQTRTLYLDTETGLELKVEAKRTIRGTEIEGETLLGDYKDVGGLMMPHSMESGVKGSPQTQKMVIEKVELNPDLPDSLFAMPAGTRPAAAPDSVKAAVQAATDSVKSAATGAAKTGMTEATKKAGAVKGAIKGKKP